MTAGKILVAEHDGAHLLKLTGDVRVTHCNTIDNYLNSIFSKPDFIDIVIDLRKAEGADSTTLGLLAKIAMEAKKRTGHKPTVLSTNPDITRLLNSMCFSYVCEIRSEDIKEDEQLSELPALIDDEEHTRERVIMAHRVLMGICEHNKATFKDLVDTLERG
jgi:anti-anti-sigma factor